MTTCPLHIIKSLGERRRFMKQVESKKSTHKQFPMRREPTSSILRRPILDTKNYFFYTEIKKGS